MKFLNCTSKTEINHPIAVAEKLLTPESVMYNELKEKNDWKYNSGSSENVIRLLFYIQFKPVEIFLFRPKNPWTKMIGFSNGKDIFINIYRLDNLNVTDLIGLMLHEYAHHVGFNHGLGWFANYKTQDKCQYSVPYYLSSNVEKWL